VVNSCLQLIIIVIALFRHNIFYASQLLQWASVDREASLSWNSCENYLEKIYLLGISEIALLYLSKEPRC